jgi:4-oxalomesaconate tautomerase
VEHPSGEFTVELDIAVDGASVRVRRSAVLRTARRLFEGRALVPAAVWRATATGR